jgi:hypothetical protein
VGRDYWVVLCKHAKAHRYTDAIFDHKIRLAETDARSMHCLSVGLRMFLRGSSSPQQGFSTKRSGPFLYITLLHSHNLSSRYSPSLRLRVMTF